MVESLKLQPSQSRFAARLRRARSDTACRLSRSPEGRGETGAGRLRPPRQDVNVLRGQLAAVGDDAAELALALAGLVAVKVFLAGLAALELATGGHAEAFFRPLVGLL